jgi:hypothetical protein
VFLTLQFQIADGKNDSGRKVCRLSNRKRALCQDVATRFSEAYQQVVQWGLDHFDEIPFTFQITKAGELQFKKDGSPQMAKTGAHYLANWLSTRVELSSFNLPSKIKNGVLNQVSETLLSQYGLRQMAHDDPKRLTGDSVGTVIERSFRSNELANARNVALDHLIESETEEMGPAVRELSALTAPRLLPVLFAGPKDFLLFQHGQTGRIFVCLPLLARGDERCRTVKNGQGNLVPLRLTDKVNLPRSKQWVLLPLHHIAKRKSRNAETMLKNPLVLPRTAELIVRDDALFLNIVVRAPDPEPFTPKTFMGVHIGYYKVSAVLLGHEGDLIDEYEIDLSDVRRIISDASKQRRHAFNRSRSDRHPRYRGRLKLRREEVVHQIIAVALEHDAAIGIEDISGVSKSTKSRRANLFRSHWDFGRFNTVLTQKCIQAGIPTRGRKKELPSLYGSVAMLTCSMCEATGTKKAKEDRPLTFNNGQAHCSKCNMELDRDINAAANIAKAARRTFLKKKR